jgi:hypothetical protein
MPRSSEYSDKVAARILEEITSGRSLRSICKDRDMPAASTVFLWLSRNAAFAEQYARARVAQADAMAEDILDIADTPQLGKKTKKAGKVTETTTGDMIEHRRLRIESRKWLMAKLVPKKYGEKLDLHVGGSLQTMPQEDIDARITELLGKAGIGAAAGGAGTTQGEE